MHCRQPLLPTTTWTTRAGPRAKAKAKAELRLSLLLPRRVIGQLRTHRQLNAKPKMDPKTNPSNHHHVGAPVAEVSRPPRPPQTTRTQPTQRPDSQLNHDPPQRLGNTRNGSFGTCVGSSTRTKRIARISSPGTDCPQTGRRGTILGRRGGSPLELRRETGKVARKTQS